MQERDRTKEEIEEFFDDVEHVATYTIKQRTKIGDKRLWLIERVVWWIQATFFDWAGHPIRMEECSICWESRVVIDIPKYHYSRLLEGVHYGGNVVVCKDCVRLNPDLVQEYGLLSY